MRLQVAPAGAVYPGLHGRVARGEGKAPSESCQNGIHGQLAPARPAMGRTGRFVKGIIMRTKCTRHLIALIVTAGALLAPSAASASITLPGHNSWNVATTVDSKNAFNTLAYGLDSPQQQTVCANCTGGEHAALGTFNGGTDLIAFLTDVSCEPARTFLTSGAHAQVTQPGPLTWQIGWDDGGGGGPSCPFADADFDDLVATISASYRFDGFFAPVDNEPAVTLANAGRSIPVRFSLNGDAGFDIFAGGSPSSRQVACNSGAPIDLIEEETTTAGGSALQYNATTNTYSYVWKTDKAWVGTCRQLTVKLNDGSVHTASFKFK
jgi:hypothetical protein